MSKKRKTKKEKIISVIRKTQIKKAEFSKKTEKQDSDILIVPVKFIKKDLLKTLIVSIVFIAIIIGLWKYLG